MLAGKGTRVQEVGFLSAQGRDHVAVAVFVLVMIVVAEFAHGFDEGTKGDAWTMDGGRWIHRLWSVVYRHPSG